MKHYRYFAILAAGAILTAAIPGLAQAAAKYKEIDVANGGSVKGKLTFEGALPDDAVERILITKNPDVCGTGEREVVWVDVKDGALRGAFVFIDKIKEGKKWAEPEDGKYLVDQKGCRFRPWAQVIRPGVLFIRNSDQGVAHNMLTRNVFYGRKGRKKQMTLFNFQQPEVGDIEKKVKPKRGPLLATNCEVHNFMFGFMMAPGHPYAVVVGDDGSFSIDNIPPGAYKVKAWHPRFGIKETKLTVPGGGAVDANFVFSQ